MATCDVEKTLETCYQWLEKSRSHCIRTGEELSKALTDASFDSRAARLVGRTARRHPREPRTAIQSPLDFLLSAVPFYSRVCQY